MRVIGLAQAGTPVGNAAHGPGGVAAGVWRQPELYLARWAKGRRRGRRVPPHPLLPPPRLHCDLITADVQPSLAGRALAS